MDGSGSGLGTLDCKTGVSESVARWCKGVLLLLG
jgi:hypothetical protein